MKRFLLRVIRFSAIFALFALALTPALALAAPEETAASHCGNISAAAKVPAPDTCQTHCRLLQSRLSSAADARIVSFTTTDNLNLPVCVTTDPTAEATSVYTKTIPPQPVTESPPQRGVVYQCRNSLNSEDPASL